MSLVRGGGSVQLVGVPKCDVVGHVMLVGLGQVVRLGNCRNSARKASNVLVHYHARRNGLGDMFCDTIHSTVKLVVSVSLLHLRSTSNPK